MPEIMTKIATPMPTEKPIIALSPSVGLLRDAADSEMYVVGGGVDANARVEVGVALREVVVGLRRALAWVAVIVVVLVDSGDVRWDVEGDVMDVRSGDSEDDGIPVDGRFVDVDVDVEPETPIV
jgi:hypothetical protein